MTSFRQCEKIFKISVFVALAAMLAMQIAARRGLFADGAYYLVALLERQDFAFQHEKARAFAVWFLQFPTLAAVRLGVTDLPFLTYLFSGWVCAAPLLVWGLALARLADDILFWPFVGLFTLVYFNVNFFVIGEFNLSYALSALCLALLLSQKRQTQFDLAALMGAALLLVMSYASTLFMGPLLGWLALRHRARAQTEATRLCHTALAALFMAATLVGIWSFLFPGIPGNKAGAMNVDVLFYAPQTGAMILGLGLLASLFFVAAPGYHYIIFWVVLAGEGVLLFDYFRTPPLLAYAIRAFIGIALFMGAGAITWGVCARARWQRVEAYFWIVPLFVLFAEMAVLDLRQSVAHVRYIDHFATVVNTHSGFLDYDAYAPRSPDDLPFGWSWTYPSMSLLLRDNVHGAIILNPDWGAPNQLFDPVTQLPDLTRYYR